MKILLITPPFSQINTPYPSVMNLSAFLQLKGYEVESFDLSLEVILKIFSKEGLTRLFNEVDPGKIEQESIKRIYVLKDKYINVIDSVVEFLQGKNQNMAIRFVQEGFLPQGESFAHLEDESFAFGNSGQVDKAVYYCTLLIEDLTKFIQATISPEFGLSRYAEKIAVSIPDFNQAAAFLEKETNLIEKIIEEEIEKKIEDFKPDAVGFTLPFPGNLMGTLISSRHIKNLNNEIKIIYGGGYVNTELRQISDPAIFKYTDYIVFDDGEIPLLKILQNIEGKISRSELCRTAVCNNENVLIINQESRENISHSALPVPSIRGINPDKYISLTEILNPMLKLWTDGYQNKIAAAHGCYWKKCTFCDVNLDYIGNYSPAKAAVTVDRMEKMMAESKRNVFHFTDEAAPPALLKEIAVEIIKRNLVVSWWGNIRFEESFTPGLCRLLAKSGCIAVSGGLEVADDRLLKLIKKGLTTAQTARVCKNFREASILVHTYLMYGFPTETDQEIIDSLEMVRQMFELDLINSAFWHRFALTIHSPVAQDPDYFKIRIENVETNSFANNELRYTDLTGSEPDKFGPGLHKAVYNFMHGNLINESIEKWFSFATPQPGVDKNYIEKALSDNTPKSRKSAQCIWFASLPEISGTGRNTKTLTIQSEDTIGEWVTKNEISEWLITMAEKSVINKDSNNVILSDWVKSFPGGENDFFEFSKQEIWKEICDNFLVIV